MLIAIDCGNTNTVIGLYEGRPPDGAFRHVFRIETDEHLSAADYRAKLAQECVAAGIDDPDIDGAVIASVVPDALAALSDFAAAASGAAPVVVGALGNVIGCEVLVDQAAKVGADRLVNTLAAHALHPGPAVVVDFGTATTFDVVSADGAYVGGVIAPGVNLALGALHEATALLPDIEVAKPERVIGTGTVDAMQSGIYWGYLGLIEGLIARIEGEYGGADAFTVIATGGLAPLFAGGTEAIDVVEPTLTLTGLILNYQINRPS